MTPRARVLAALNHQQPDRVPLDLSGHRSSGISAIAYARLRRFLGLKPAPIRIYDPVQQLAIVDDDVLDRFEIDTIELGRAFAREEKYWTDWVLPDGTPCFMPIWAKPERQEGEWVIRSKSERVIARMPDGVLYFEQAFFPYAEEDPLDQLEEALDECMWAALASPPGPIAAGEDAARTLRRGASQLRSETDRAIIALFGGNLLEMGQFMYRNDNFFLLLAGDPERAHAFLDRVTELHLRNLETFLSAVGPYIDVLLFGDDLGMQSGPQISPAMYREFFKPREARMWKRARELAPQVKILLHCCGGVREFLDDLIDAGMDAINPVQITCRGMTPEDLKRDFGSRMTFWGGGCDTRDVITKRTPREVRDHVRHLLRTWTPGGGYVFQQVHNIMADIPPENIVAMLDTAREFS